MCKRTTHSHGPRELSTCIYLCVTTPTALTTGRRRDLVVPFSIVTYLSYDDPGTLQMFLTLTIFPLVQFVWFRFVFVCLNIQQSYFYGVRVRDREDARENRHDELGLRGVCDGGGIRHEARPASGMFRLRRNGGLLRSNGQAHGALDSCNSKLGADRCVSIVAG